MDHLTPCFRLLLAPFWVCFCRCEVFATFSAMTLAWIVCLGRRTLSRLWETTGQSADHDHSRAFRLFSSAVWNFDEICRILLVKLLTTFLPGSRVWLVADDTLCHKRGAKVAFGGIFLDAVLSSKKHKNFRFGTNWVTLGLIIQLPFRKDRFFCVNILWRLYAKKGDSNAELHRTKPELALEMVQLVASWLPGRQLIVVADSVYVGKHLLRGLPENVAAVGPIHPKATLSEPLAEGYSGRRKKGERLSTPREALEDDRWPWQDFLLRHPKGEKQLQVKRIGVCCWYNSAGQMPLQVVLVRDPSGKWRDEALLCSELGLSVQEVILGYLKRWSVEVAYGDGKQRLGFHEPMVYSASAVERAHPMAWFVGGLVLLWYAQVGQHQMQAHRHRPWYKDKVEPTFADMLACCRLFLWENWLKSDPARTQEKLSWLLEYLATAS